MKDTRRRVKRAVWITWFDDFIPYRMIAVRWTYRGKRLRHGPLPRT